MSGVDDIPLETLADAWRVKFGNSTPVVPDQLIEIFWRDVERKLHNSGHLVYSLETDSYHLVDPNANRR